ncbi:hypothetical protein GCM10027277_43770 [Pseudoduganella ginsengisoli]
MMGALAQVGGHRPFMEQAQEYVFFVQADVKAQENQAGLQALRRMREHGRALWKFVEKDKWRVGR